MIMWLPPLDAVDEAMFPEASKPGWMSLGKWVGQDMYYEGEHKRRLTLQLFEVSEDDITDPARRIVLWKFDGIYPQELTDDDCVDAAMHCGIKFFKREPLHEGFSGVLLTEEFVETPVTGSEI